MKRHFYHTHLTWTGNIGTGTDQYKGYERSYTIQIANKPEIFASADPAFRGDPRKHNPEDIFLSAISSCHMLWYLHLCAVNQVVVLSYVDRAEGIMIEEEDGRGSFQEVTLYPEVTVASEQMIDQAVQLHQEANRFCFIANSLNFKVKHEPSIFVEPIG